MKNNLKISALLGGVLLSIAAAGAQAQAPATQPVQKPITIKLGAYFPTAGSGENAGGHTQFSAGLDYAFAKTTRTPSPILPSIYFDYQGGSKNGGHVDSYGLGVAARYYTSTPGASVSPYFGAGVGIYDESLKRSGVNSGSNANIGAKLMAGLEFSSALVELNYQFLPKHNGVNPDGLGLQVGYRF